MVVLSNTFESFLEVGHVKMYQQLLGTKSDLWSLVSRS